MISRARAIPKPRSRVRTPTVPPWLGNDIFAEIVGVCHISALPSLRSALCHSPAAHGAQERLEKAKPLFRSPFHLSWRDVISERGYWCKVDCRSTSPARILDAVMLASVPAPSGFRLHQISRATELAFLSQKEYFEPLRCLDALSFHFLPDTDVSLAMLSFLDFAPRNFPSVRRLHLSRNNLGRGGSLSLACSLVVGAFPSLMELDVASTFLHTVGANALFRCLRSNTPCLTHLRASRNGIEKEAFFLLARLSVRPHFPPLRRLDVSHNRMQDAGFAALFRAFRAGGMPRLVTLGMESNDLTTVSPTFLRCHVQLWEQESICRRDRQTLSFLETLRFDATLHPDESAEQSRESASRLAREERKFVLPNLRRLVFQGEPFSTPSPPAAPLPASSTPNVAT